MSVEFNHTTAFIGMRDFDQEHDDTEYEVSLNKYFSSKSVCLPNFNYSLEYKNDTVLSLHEKGEKEAFKGGFFVVNFNIGLHL